jgi:hypothetical protein
MRAVSEARKLRHMTPARENGSLSIHRSFLVRLYASSNPPSGKIAGLVEHVVSGEAMEFSSGNELVTSIAMLLHVESVRSE